MQKLNDLNKYIVMDQSSCDKWQPWYSGWDAGCAAKERLIDTIKSIIKLGAPPIHKSKKTGKCYGTHSKVRLDSLGILPKARVKHTRNVKRWIYIQTIGVRTDEHGKGHGKKCYL